MDDRIFYDRHEAGVVLGNVLAPAYKDVHALALGIPRGGVVVAYEVARILRAGLSVVITKKLPHPLQDELAIGAMAEDGSVFLTAFAKNIAQETICAIKEKQQKEIESRVQRFRNGKPLPSMRDRICILVDDGIATGSTVVPAIKLCQKEHAAKVVVAAPVSGSRYAAEIDALADEVVIVEQPEDFYAVGQVYRDFRHLSDQEVTDLLDDYEHESSPGVQDRRRKW